MATGFVPGTAAVTSTLVEITINCNGLADTDHSSFSDPMCVTYVKDSSGWKEIHRTEVLKNTLHPTFAQKPMLTYNFEQEQKLKFEIYDIDSTSNSLNRHDFLGSAIANLGQLVGSGKTTLPVELRKSKNHGTITLVVEEMSGCKEKVEMVFSVRNVPKTRFFSKTDSFLKFYRSTESVEFILCHCTETAKSSQHPKYKKITKNVQQLCNGDHDRNLKIELWDHHGSGSHVLLGETFVTLRQLLEGPSSNTTFEFISAKKHKKGKSPATLILADIKLSRAYTFLDYIRGGTQLQTTFAIDFTASNGPPFEPHSLHYIHLTFPSPYSRAIQSVGAVIRDYDSDKKFPVLGFGAMLPPDGRISHEFFVNGSDVDPYCEDINGVVDAYHSCIRRVQLCGPTNMAPVINHVAKFASSFRDGSHYFILVIITDGVITDMPQTKAAIIEASFLPMSIIIIGVGPADFSAMEELDADTIPLTSKWKRANRDIVQFVPDPMGTVGGMAVSSTMMAELARDVLAEIPGQFLGYMSQANIKPNPPQNNVTVLPPDPEFAALSEPPSFMNS